MEIQIITNCYNNTWYLIILIIESTSFLYASLIDFVMQVYINMTNETLI